MVVKSTSAKRNTYKDKDGNLIPGMTLPEALGKTITILAKREYTWGKYSGMAIKVRGSNDKLAIIEITAETPIKALNASTMPKLPCKARFESRKSENNRMYYTVVLLDEDGEPILPAGTDEPLPF